MDANLEGLGAHYQQQVAQGCWAFNPQRIVSNTLEFRASMHALLTFGPALEGKRVLLHLDNKISVAYIKRWGTTSPTLLEEVNPIWDLSQTNLIDVISVYVPAIESQLAESLSQDFLSNYEWSLSPQAFSFLTQRWGILEIDLAATLANTKFWHGVSPPNPYQTQWPGIDWGETPQLFFLSFLTSTFLFLLFSCQQETH